jgi:tetratricopeptide (TPR) repeat protein
MKRTSVAFFAVWIVLTVLAGCQTPTTQQLVADGVTQFQVGRLDKAKATLTRALDQSPSSPAALFYMGRIHHLEGFYEQAIYYYQCCIDADPSRADAQRYLDEAQAKAGPAGDRLRFIPDLPRED